MSKAYCNFVNDDDDVYKVSVLDTVEIFFNKSSYKSVSKCYCPLFQSRLFDFFKSSSYQL